MIYYSEKVPLYVQEIISYLKSVDYGQKQIEVWEIKSGVSDEALKDWAIHFRNHYCLDEELEDLIKGTGLTATDFLNKYKFPDSKKFPGPILRAGDFGEILVCDLLEYMEKYWVPRARYLNKEIKHESPKGSDVIGMKLVNYNLTSFNETEIIDSQNDELIVVEAKAKLTNPVNTSTLQVAINDSSKDLVRFSETLSSLKQKYIWSKDNKKHVISRFQSPKDRPYKMTYAAAAIILDENMDGELSPDCNEHLEVDKLRLMLIKGRDLMNLVHSLYDHASKEFN